MIDTSAAVDALSSSSSENAEKDTIAPTETDPDAEKPLQSENSQDANDGSQTQIQSEETASDAVPLDQTETEKSHISADLSSEAPTIEEKIQLPLITEPPQIQPPVPPPYPAIAGQYPPAGPYPQQMPPYPPPYDHNQTMLMPPHGPPPHYPGHYGYPPHPHAGPLLHIQEKAALNQQIQELHCYPQTPETQDKIMRLQERLTILQTHETAEQCTGGPHCLLNASMYQNQMVESPQVSSTTGRGRGKSSSKPRKPRAKKGDKATGELPTGETPIPPTNLPVSEDCVTQGAGDTGMEYNESCDYDQDLSSNELDTSTDGKKKKARKPRAPKDPNKPPKEKTSKEKKKKEKDSSDPEKPKQKKGRKSRKDSESADGENTSEKPETTIEDPEKSEATVGTGAEDNPDYDDIPVSKIPTKAVTSEDNDTIDKDVDEDTEQVADSATPSSKKKKRRDGASTSKKKSSSGGKTMKTKGKKRGRLVTDDDEGGDDILTTPPPSPTLENELDSSKRRSARNTQRKKYSDDALLRFSDDETASLLSSSPVKKDKKQSVAFVSSADIDKIEGGVVGGEASTISDETSELDKDKVAASLAVIPAPTPIEDPSKPNYVYVNTGDEDSMVVQYVLANRMGKRELIPDPPPKPKEEPKPEPEKVEEDSEKKEEETEKEVSEEKEEKKEDDEEKSVVKIIEKKDEPEEAEKMDVDEAEGKFTLTMRNGLCVNNM